MGGIEVVLPALGGVLAIIGGLYLMHAVRVSSRPAEAERGLSPIYVERAGGRFDGWNLTMPFVRVAAYQNLVVISSVMHQILLRPGDVSTIEAERHLFTTGLRLHHRRQDIPGVIIIWPRHKERLRAALESSLSPSRG